MPRSTGQWRSSRQRLPPDRQLIRPAAARYAKSLAKKNGSRSRAVYLLNSISPKARPAHNKLRPPGFFARRHNRQTVKTAKQLNVMSGVINGE